MSRVFISGFITIETTLKIESFPLDYYPVTYPFFGINSSVSGVGFNVAKALSVLGNNVDVLAVVGEDEAATRVENAFRKAGISSVNLLKNLAQTCESVIVYDNEGRRQIHTDLKDIQEANIPKSEVRAGIDNSELTIFGNLNANRQHLAYAKQSGKLLAIDVHVLGDINDTYNKDFIDAADILFLSDEACLGYQKEFLVDLAKTCQAEIIVMGMGGEGSLLYQRATNDVTACPAYYTRDIVSTVGAGDALFSAFLHAYLNSKNAEYALKVATVFASYKIGVAGAADGFLTPAELEQQLARCLVNLP